MPLPYADMTFEWKFARPDDDYAAEDLKYASYLTAIDRDPTTTIICVRMDGHAETRKNGVFVKDDPHITVSTKNPQQVQERTHRTNHGYTVSVTDLTFVRATTTDVKPDDTPDINGNPIWPMGLPSEKGKC
ncbi:MAG: hypothetical protein Q9210_000566 [Variospora velana]